MQVESFHVQHCYDHMRRTANMSDSDFTKVISSIESMYDGDRSGVARAFVRGKFQANVLHALAKLQIRAPQKIRLSTGGV